MKKLSAISLYAFGLELVLTSAILLSHPPTTVFAASCFATCQYGSDIHVSGGECSCKDNVGCTWTDTSGKSFSQACAKRTEGGVEIGIVESNN
jgi:hypothetical protein